MNGPNSASRYRSKGEAVILQIINTREYLFVYVDCRISFMSDLKFSLALEVSPSGFIVSFAVAARYASSLVVLSVVSQSKISVGTSDFACFALHSRTPRPDPPPRRSGRDPERGKHQHSLLSNYDTARRGAAGRSSQPISVLLARLSPLITLLLLTTPLSESANPKREYSLQTFMLQLQIQYSSPTM